jgi:peptidoglycan hydrolase-like protein with peptidoglycan-binding domain
MPPAPAQDDTLSTPQAIAAARQNLKLLGYESGKPHGIADLALRKALMAFQKDQALTPDGRLTVSLAEKLRTLRTELSKPQASSASAGTYFYSDGSVRSQPANFLVPSGADLVADVSANFLQPMRPGAQAIYHLGHRAKDGTFTAIASVTCRVGHVEQTNIPAGLFDTLPASCSEAGKSGSQAQWRWNYATRLGLVVHQQAGTDPHNTRDLVAIRPSTVGWPAAARMGLDWALTHALDTADASAPVQWSSTGVAQHFQILAFASLSPHDAGLSGGDGLCRRFDMIGAGPSPRHYPGIACKDSQGGWFLPGSHVRLASPATGLADPPATAIAGN